jgi:hypothetical protein
MRRFMLGLAIAALVVAGCTQDGEPDGGPNANDGGRVRLAAARPAKKAEWSAFDALPDLVVPPKVAKDKLDHVHSGMTLRELTTLLGRGWMYQNFEGCGIITWTGDDGRELRVWPTTYGPDEVIDAGPRQVGGTGGRGRMWMTGPGKDQQREDLTIPAK